MSPLKTFPASISEAERETLRKAAEDAIRDEVFPAMVKFRDFVAGTYLPAGDVPIGARNLPDGKNYYALCTRRFTTTEMTPEEIHKLGLAEVSRIRKKMEEVVRTSGFKGTFAEYCEYLRTDKKFYYNTTDELVAGYRDLAKRIDAELPRFFTELPRNTYGVKAFPDYEAPSQTNARYYPGAADGSRAGYFMCNTFRLNARPKYEMESLTLHEAVPGHHLQISRAQEITGLPDFRRNAYYTAYIEGWGLYAESLGEELGFYKDSASKFGAWDMRCGGHAGWWLIRACTRSTGTARKQSTS